MKATRWLPLVASIAIVSWSGIAPASSQATSPAVGCDSVLTADTTLSQDVTDCSGDGLVIGADDIVLNLNGHIVQGDGVPAVEGTDVGIRVDGHRGVTIANGTISKFDLGVLLDGSAGNVVSGLKVHDNAGRGVMLADGANANRVENNTAAHNGRAGFALIDSRDNVVQEDLSVSNAAGVHMEGASDNAIVRNTLSSNGAGVQALDGSDHNLIDSNYLDADGSEGVEVIFANSNTISRNQIRDTGSGIILESSDNTTITDNDIRHSVASACDGCGIGIQIYGNNNRIERNTALDSPRYGIEVDDFQDPGHSPASENILWDNVVNKSGEGITIGPEAGGVVLDTVIGHNVVTNAIGDGIQLLGPSTGLETSTLIGNVAIHNGILGIDAVPGVIDGGGNHAAANGNPLQCVNVVCR